VTKLTSLGLELAYKQSIDMIVSYYVEPYCLAAHIVAQATGLPQVARTAGSDAGRLWQLPQFGACYNHIFKSANAIVCSPSLIPKMISIGVESDRITSNPEKHVSLLDLFAPDGPALDVEKLRQEVSSAEQDQFRQSLFGEFDPSLSYFGVYGKLGKAKGTYQLLAALKRMKERGIRAGLLVMAHERPEAHGAFHDYVTTNNLLDRVCQLPFLPHWRVPEFIRQCVAVCCLEQDFPIKFHDPVVAREVLTCGSCLVGSTEIIGKLPHAEKLVDDYNCIAINDVNNIDDLECRMIAILEDQDRLRRIGHRARQYCVELEQNNTFPQRFAALLSDLVEMGRLSPENVLHGPPQSV
jgi:glycosyltransferase involved in cell wall biosynthesis